MIHVFMLVGGLAVTAVNAWQRLGRSPAARRWARGTHPDFAQRNVLVLWPSLAVALLGGAGLGASERWGAPTWPTALLVAAGLLAWVAFAALPLPVPTFLKPGWYRERQGSRG